MRVTPRYAEPPVIDLGDLGFDVSPVIRQRDRLVEVLSQLSADEWAVSSRCAGWSVQDVAEHLVGVNQFWVLSIGAGLRNEPTRLLATFDPVTHPAAMVGAAGLNAGRHPPARWPCGPEDPAWSSRSTSPTR